MDKSTQSGEGPSNDSELHKKLIEELTKTQQEALKRAPEAHTGILQISWFMCLLVAGLGGYILYLGNTALGFAAIVVGVIGFIVAMVLLRPQSSPNNLKAMPSAPTAPKTRAGQWSRVTMKLPIPLNHLNDLSARLQQIRALAQTKYSAILMARNLPAGRIVPDRVRTNVFLPDNKDAIYGEVAGLFIPKGLHHGMKNEAERRVRFRPNEGLTGRVFTMEKAFGALRESADSDWQLIHLEGVGGKGDETFQLTLEQISLIDKELRWIVSFPLKATLDNVAQTFGVLNVDGFTEALSPDEMQSIYNTIKEAADQFAREVFKLEKSRITITVEDLITMPAA